MLFTRKYLPCFMFDPFASIVTGWISVIFNVFEERNSHVLKNFGRNEIIWRCKISPSPGLGFWNWPGRHCTQWPLYTYEIKIKSLFYDSFSDIHVYVTLFILILFDKKICLSVVNFFKQFRLYNNNNPKWEFLKFNLINECSVVTLVLTRVHFLP